MADNYLISDHIYVNRNWRITIKWTLWLWYSNLFQARILFSHRHWHAIGMSESSTYFRVLPYRANKFPSPHRLSRQSSFRSCLVWVWFDFIVPELGSKAVYCVTRCLIKLLCEPQCTLATDKMPLMPWLKCQFKHHNYRMNSKCLFITPWHSSFGSTVVDSHTLLIYLVSSGRSS